MTQRERYIRALKFDSPDHVPLVEWPIRESTLNRWKAEGLTCSPEEHAHLDSWGLGLPVSAGMYPPFEEEVIEENEGYKIWIDFTGARRKDFKNLSTPGFVTRSWLEFPVKSRADLPGFRERFQPETPGRYPSDWAACVKNLRESAVPVKWSTLGPFWIVRQWMGFEGACLAFHEAPTLIEEMIEISMNCLIKTVSEGLRKVKVDEVTLMEDMAYKTASMISPLLVRKFLLPWYRRLNEFFRAHGVDVILVDSDGHCSELIPIWLEAGFDGFSPVEIAAGNDPVAIRKKYPKQVAMMGGIDKRELAKDRQSIHREVMSKVPWLIERGGYIPHVDHAIPPDVSLANFTYYRELLQKVVSG